MKPTEKLAKELDGVRYRLNPEGVIEGDVGVLRRAAAVVRGFEGMDLLNAALRTGLRPPERVFKMIQEAREALAE